MEDQPPSDNAAPPASKERLSFEEVAQLAFLGVEALTRILIAKGVATEVEIQAVVGQVRREYTSRLAEAGKDQMH